MSARAASRRLVLCLLLACPIVSPAPAPASEPPGGEVLASAKARDHVGETRTVEMTVRSIKDASQRREYYLDSEADFRDEKNCAVVISYDHLDAFKRARIEDPSQHYKEKTIRVTGKLIHENEQVRIRVEDPKQIKIVESVVK